MPTLNSEYWETRYREGQAGWDTGSPTSPLAEYCSQLTDKTLKILIPGCGNGHEAEVFLNHGFNQITLLDYAQSPVNEARKKYKTFIENGRLQVICEDFFEHHGKYDLIIEQTFFCALNPPLRKKYAEKMAQLLLPKGKLAGLLFNFPLSEEGPPFGGSQEEYEACFKPYFTIKKMESCVNSIKPRENRELFFIFQKLA